MQLASQDQVQANDVVLAADGKVWKYEPTAFPQQPFSSFAGEGSSGSAVVFPVALLVRGGSQMCCTPDPEPVAPPTPASS